MRLRINEIDLEVAGSADVSLLTYLRDTLLLTGAKYGCGKELCGACGVLIDGRFALSCRVRLASLDGMRVETVEGLGTAQSPSPVQRRVRDTGAGQCGFCLPGILVRAEALWRQRASVPDRAELAAALDGNLCRCGAHVEIMNAVLAGLSDRARDAHDV